MKTLKNTIFLTLLIFASVPVFSQVKKYDANYQQEMGKALDKLSPEQIQVVLEHAAQMVEKEDARKALACIANNLSKEDQAALLRKAKRTRDYSPMTVPVSPPAIAEPIGPTTTIEFKETTFDFGEIDQGEKVSYVYKFTNTGNEPLIIKNAKGSCGCTVPKWPKEPIAPGASGELLVEYNSKGKKGKETKRVTVTANTTPAQSFLTITGHVNVQVKN